ncbi:MAG TPA: LLM class F420-dependent oxidoreductase [Acidimicrobiales bacterium]|nr:LLM class F420-dependent oxidoreductase [Acidimicrobiales bacterium]
MTKLGLITPVLTLNPRVHNSWEETADFSAVVAIARAADRLGYHHLTCSEHVAVPAGDIAARRGSRYYDPLATFGYLAAHTSTIRFETHVLVLGYHHPFEIAKQYGTLDAISGGRLILGLGVGSLQEEFDLLGAPFEDRGPRADEAIRELRRILGRRDVDGFIIDPHAVQSRVPIWIGGRTFRSLRRAVELADGWCPFGLRSGDVATMVERVGDLPEGFEIVLFPEPMPDPIGDPDGARAVLAPYLDAGATTLNLRLRSDSLAHCLEQLEAVPILLR